MEKRVKNHLYVGGIAEDVTEELLRAAFIPFGDIKDVLIPREHSTNKPRGFGFVTFEEEDDAAEAMDNMHESELAGRVLNVRMAKPRAVNKNRAVWSADEWMEKNLQDGDIQDKDDAMDTLVAQPAGLAAPGEKQ